MEQKKITRDLEYHFTDEERNEMGKQLAAENQNKRKLEDQKKSVMSQYGSQINESAETINTLADKLASGYEFRKTECVVEWHTPERNKKTITRTDDGSSWSERMTEYDHDLFNQWEEEQAADLENAGEHEFEQEVNVEEETPEGEEATEAEAVEATEAEANESENLPEQPQGEEVPEEAAEPEFTEAEAEAITAEESLFPA